MKRRKRWCDFTPRQRKTIALGAAVEAVLTTVALVDLSRRPSAEVRGSKRLWGLGCFVQPFGPIAYLAFGRQPGS